MFEVFNATFILVTFANSFIVVKSTRTYGHCVDVDFMPFTALTISTSTGRFVTQEEIIKTELAYEGHPKSIETFAVTFFTK